ncbi:MAG: hypothetical protein C4345_15355, partial [Chloroflexota bacterium]
GADPSTLDQAIILAARSRIEQHPVYERVAARALLRSLSEEMLGEAASAGGTVAAYHAAFTRSIRWAVKLGLLAPELLDFDLE